MPYTSTKRELIEAALEALRPANDISTQWAMRRAIVRMARMARDDVRDDKLISRKDLSDEMRAIFSDIQSLQKRLSKRVVSKALFRAIVASDFDENDDALARFGARHMEKLPDALGRLHGDLLTLGVAAETAVYSLGLKGQRGVVTPWHRVQLPAKVKFAAIGYQLYQAARCLKKPPDAKNGQLAGFLALAWEAATGETDVQDFSAPIRTAKGRGLSKDRIPALVLAHNDASYLLNSAARWEATHRSRSK